MTDTGFKSPSAEGLVNSDFVNPENMFSSNDVYATADSGADFNDVYNFAFGLPEGALIEGIEVVVEGKASGGTDLSDVRLSWDAGNTYTDPLIVSHEETESEETVGGSANTWGRTWSVSEFADGTFLVDLDKDSGGTTSYDHVKVKVYYYVPVTNLNKGTKGTKEIATITAEENIGEVLSNVPEGINGVFSTVLSKDRVGLELN